MVACGAAGVPSAAASLLRSASEYSENGFCLARCFLILSLSATYVTILVADMDWNCGALLSSVVMLSRAAAGRAGGR